MQPEKLSVTAEDFELLAENWNKTHCDDQQRTSGDMRRLYSQGLIVESDVESARELQARRQANSSTETINSDTLYE